MSLDKEFTKKRLDELWEKDLQLFNIEGEKYVIISDLHMGDGGSADDFRENEKTLETALEFYNARGYTLILLGDVEEFWQFDFSQIRDRYFNTVYRKIQAFNNRMIRIFGNHDSEWGCPSDPAFKSSRRHDCAPEALKMRLNPNSDPCILLVHGHQGSVDSDKRSWLSRAGVRILKPFEEIGRWTGLYRNPSATKSQVTIDYEQVYYSWAKDRKVIIICGHSHRAIFASKSWAYQLQEQIADLQAEIYARRTNKDFVRNKIREMDKIRQELLEERLKGRDIDPTKRYGEPTPCYFNSGCALYTDGITAIEIIENKIKLVKWHKNSPPPPEEYEKGDLNKFIQKVIN